MGAEAIDSGQAAATLEKLRQFGAKHASNSIGASTGHNTAVVIFPRGSRRKNHAT